MLTLAAVAGGVDAIGWLTLGHLFTAHMSGNGVGVTTHGALGQWADVGRHAWAIGSFLVGLAAGATAATIAYRRSSRASFAGALALEAALLVALMTAGGSMGAGGAPRESSGSHLALVTLAAVAMGIQSATLRRVGDVRVRTTYITGTLTRLVESAVQLAFLRRDRLRGRGGDPAEEAAVRRNVALLGSIPLCYAVGGGASAWLERAIGMRALALPIAAVVAAIVIDRRLAHAGVAGAGPEDG
ncbi:MAG TPA: YoaK family protein [Polyangiaceae bacterium]|nr:YoaK family protein [Polyangiaceae bacterium]